MALWLLFRAGPESSSRFLVAAINRRADKGRTVHHQRPLTTKLKANIKHTSAAILHWRWCLHSSWDRGESYAHVASCARAEERYSNYLNRVVSARLLQSCFSALDFPHTHLCVCTSGRSANSLCHFMSTSIVGFCPGHVPVDGLLIQPSAAILSSFPNKNLLQL